MPRRGDLGEPNTVQMAKAAPVDKRGIGDPADGDSAANGEESMGDICRSHLSILSCTHRIRKIPYTAMISGIPLEDRVRI